MKIRISHLLSLSGLCTALLSTAQAYSQVPYLIRTFESPSEGTMSSGVELFDNERHFVKNDAVYFTADDGIHGKELQKTDGSAAGTNLIKDIIS